MNIVQIRVTYFLKWSHHPWPRVQAAYHLSG